MDRHGFYTDISSSFNNGLPATNIKYHLPQIPPQPPPQPPPHPPPNASHQTTPIYHQMHQHNVDQDILQQNLNLYPDDGLFDNVATACVPNTNYNINNNNKPIEYSSRKFETNTGDSITYNINNINTNIVNNISNSSSSSNNNNNLSNNSLTNGPTDFMGSQYGLGTGIKDQPEVNPTIINISNNNHNMMQPPYPYYAPKMPTIAPINELNNKFGTWANNGGNDYTVPDPNKYQSSRANQSYRYSEYPQAAHQKSQYTYNYGPYHPDTVQATPAANQHPSMINHNYDTYPHVLRTKYQPQTTTRSFHHDLNYTDGNGRYFNNCTHNYIPTQPHSYYTVPPTASKNILNPNMEYFQPNTMKPQMPPNHYMNNRAVYSQSYHESYPMAPTSQSYHDSYHNSRQHYQHLLTENSKNYNVPLQYPIEPKLPPPVPKTVPTFNNYQYYNMYNNTNATIKHDAPAKQQRACFYDTPNPVADPIHPFVDLEEQINSSKILKTRETNPMNYDCQEKYLMNRYLAKQYPQYSPLDHMSVADSAFNDTIKNQTNLRDFLSTWSVEDEEDENHRKEVNNNQQKFQNFESCKFVTPSGGEMQQHSSVIVANVNSNSNSTNTNLPDIVVDIEKPKPSGEENRSDEGEKLYILETYEVPISELNKYKHLGVINRLPDNVVPMNEKEIYVGGVESSLKFIEEIESNREKYYKNDLELEVDFEAKEKIEEGKEDALIPTVVEEKTIEEDDVKAEENIPDNNVFKFPTCIPKYRKRKSNNVNVIVSKKRKILQDCDHYDKVQREKPKFKTLKRLCVDHFNSKIFRKYSKNLIKIEEEKKEISTCIKTVIKSLKEICESQIPPKQVTTLKTLCLKKTLALNLLPQPKSLKELCENFVCGNKNMFIIQEVIQEPPKLQDLCKSILSETNIFIDVDENFCIVNEANVQDDENVFIVEEASGTFADLFKDDESFGVSENSEEGDFLGFGNDVDQGRQEVEELGFSQEENSTSTKDEENKKEEVEDVRNNNSSSEFENDNQNNADDSEKTCENVIRTSSKVEIIDTADNLIEEIVEINSNVVKEVEEEVVDNSISTSTKKLEDEEEDSSSSSYSSSSFSSSSSSSDESESETNDSLVESSSSTSFSTCSRTMENYVDYSVENLEKAMEMIHSGTVDETDFSTCTSNSLDHNSNNFYFGYNVNCTKNDDQFNETDIFSSSIDIDCVECEEIVPVNDILYKKEKILTSLRSKHVNKLNCPIVFYTKILRKYIYYQRFLKLNDRIVHKSKFNNYLALLKRRFHKNDNDVDNDNCDTNNENETETETEIESSSYQDESENSIISVKTDAESLAKETNSSIKFDSREEISSNELKSIQLTTNNNTNSSSSMSSSSSSSGSSNNNFKNTNFIHNKKRKPNFDECLLSIDKYYKKSNNNVSTTPSIINKSSNNNTNNNKFSTNIHRNVIVNVNNCKDQPKKLIIPSYKIFDQNANNNHQNNNNNFSNNLNNKLQLHNKKVPYVRLERSLYIEKLAENYHYQKMKHL